MNNSEKAKNIETKICKKCGRTLSMDKFRLVKSKYYGPYYLGQCKECEYKSQRAYLEKKKEVVFRDDIEILIKRQYKEINPKRVLNISALGIALVDADEVFVKLMDYKDVWLSNYGRVIRCSNGKFSLLQGGYDSNGSLNYLLKKNVYENGRWIYKRVSMYAAKAVVNEFIVNPDKANNIYVWHKGYDKKNYYYKNLYPLNQEQYRIVKSHFNKTGDDSEEFIEKVVNDIRYKPDDWGKKVMRPTVSGVGYWGSVDADKSSKAYLRWHDMLSRCYNQKFHERNLQYKDCTVCEEWHNFMNFKTWYDNNKPEDGDFDLDKDILLKGNTVYGPDTVAFVPHVINTLFINGKKGRGALPVGVSYDSDKKKYRAEMSFMGRHKKLGTFNTSEEAFVRYKEYKEKFIKDIAEQYKGKIPDKVYQAMMNWKIEIDD